MTVEIIKTAEGLELVSKAEYDKLAAEIERRDSIFVPIYPDADLMNKLTDVFTDTAKLKFTEDDIYVGNQELVITALINNFLKHADQHCSLSVGWLSHFKAELKAQGVDEFAKYCWSMEHTRSDRRWVGAARNAELFAENLRAGVKP